MTLLILLRLNFFIIDKISFLKSQTVHPNAKEVNVVIDGELYKITDKGLELILVKDDATTYYPVLALLLSAILLWSKFTGVFYYWKWMEKVDRFKPFSPFLFGIIWLVGWCFLCLLVSDCVISSHRFIAWKQHTRPCQRSSCHSRQGSGHRCCGILMI